MSAICHLLRDIEVVVFATPVYVPLPGDMQHFINRLCPLMDPRVEFREGRTRARLREDVAIRQFVALTTGGWWEKQNSDTVVRIVSELAANAGVEFAGAVVRPHVDVIQSAESMERGGREVLEAVERAGRELISEGAMQPATLEAVSRPLLSCEAYLRFWNSRVAADGI
jgi:multimeric flavodoxin WrbA